MLWCRAEVVLLLLASVYYKMVYEGFLFCHVMMHAFSAEQNRLLTSSLPILPSMTGIQTSSSSWAPNHLYPPSHPHFPVSNWGLAGSLSRCSLIECFACLSFLFPRGVFPIKGISLPRGSSHRASSPADPASLNLHPRGG